MNVSSFSINGERQYPVESVANMISEYILRVKGAKVKVRLDYSKSRPEVFPEDVELFTTAASYAIPAWEGGFKRKTT